MPLHKIVSILLAAALFFIVSCNTSKQSTDRESADPETTGRVSHQFRASGCATVIVVESANPDDALILIPSENLPVKFDIDGMLLTFNFHTLRMHNPEGCMQGIPAEISDISKAKTKRKQD